MLFLKCINNHDINIDLNNRNNDFGHNHAGLTTTLRTEVLWCLDTTVNHHSLTSNEGISEIFKECFPIRTSPRRSPAERKTRVHIQIRKSTIDRATAC